MRAKRVEGKSQSRWPNSIPSSLPVIGRTDLFMFALSPSCIPICCHNAPQDTLPRTIEKQNFAPRATKPVDVMEATGWLDSDKEFANYVVYATTGNHCSPGCYGNSVIAGGVWTSGMLFYDSSRFINSVFALNEESLSRRGGRHGPVRTAHLRTKNWHIF